MAHSHLCAHSLPPIAALPVQAYLKSIESLQRLDEQKGLLLRTLDAWKAASKQARQAGGRWYHPRAVCSPPQWALSAPRLSQKAPLLCTPLHPSCRSRKCRREGARAAALPVLAVALQTRCMESAQPRLPRSQSWVSEPASRAALPSSGVRKASMLRLLHTPAPGCRNNSMHPFPFEPPPQQLKAVFNLSGPIVLGPESSVPGPPVPGAASQGQVGAARDPGRHLRHSCQRLGQRRPGTGGGQIRRPRPHLAQACRRPQVHSLPLVKALAAARANKGVRAVVLRVDSPGGSAVASDVIHREVRGRAGGGGGGGGRERDCQACGVLCASDERAPSTCSVWRQLYWTAPCRLPTLLPRMVEGPIPSPSERRWSCCARLASLWLSAWVARLHRAGKSQHEACACLQLFF